MPRICVERRYEGGIARQLADEILLCTHYMDIHTCSAKALPSALPARSAASETIAAHLPVEYAVQDVAHNTLRRGTTLDWALENRIAGVGLECGQHDDPASVDNARDCIRAFVGGDDLGMPRHVLICTRSERVREGFEWVRDVAAFERVAEDEVIARDAVEGDLTCGEAGGGFIIMPTNLPVVGEEAWFTAIEVAKADSEEESGDEL